MDEILACGRIDLFAFNDHMDSTVANLAKPRKRNVMVQRTGLADREFDELVERIAARADHVPASIARMAKAARDAGIRMLSHDDDTPEMRQAFRAQGIGIAEFPVNEETAREAASGGDFIVFGAPNVVRGGSHTGWTKASDMIAKGLCSILASDYYYPAPLLAAFRLAADGVLPLPLAWNLVSAAPARAAGLGDRGELHIGRPRRHHPGRRPKPAAAAHRRGDRGRPPRSSDRGPPPAAAFSAAAQSGCGGMNRLYSVPP